MQHWDFRPNILFVFFPTRISATPTLGPNIDPIPWPRRLFLSKPLFVNPLVKIQSLMHEAICWASKLDDLDGGSRGFAHVLWLFHHEIGSGLALGSLFCLYVCVKSVVVGSQFQTAGSWAGQLGIGVIWFSFTTPHQKYWNILFVLTYSSLSFVLTTASICFLGAKGLSTWPTLDWINFSWWKSHVAGWVCEGTEHRCGNSMPVGDTSVVQLDHHVGTWAGWQEWEPWWVHLHDSVWLWVIYIVIIIYIYNYIYIYIYTYIAIYPPATGTATLSLDQNEVLR